MPRVRCTHTHTHTHNRVRGSWEGYKRSEHERAPNQFPQVLSAMEYTQFTTTLAEVEASAAPQRRSPDATQPRVVHRVGDVELKPYGSHRPLGAPMFCNFSTTIGFFKARTTDQDSESQAIRTAVEALFLQCCGVDKNDLQCNPHEEYDWKRRCLFSIGTLTMNPVLHFAEFKERVLQLYPGVVVGGHVKEGKTWYTIQ